MREVCSLLCLMKCVTITTVYSGIACESIWAGNKLPKWWNYRSAPEIIIILFKTIT